jgi:hypothetical protein
MSTEQLEEVLDWDAEDRKEANKRIRRDVKSLLLGVGLPILLAAAFIGYMQHSTARHEEAVSQGWADVNAKVADSRRQLEQCNAELRGVRNLITAGVSLDAGYQRAMTPDCK